MSDCTIWMQNVPDGQRNFISHTIAFVIASVMSAKRWHSHTRRGHSRQWPTRLFCSHGATLACTRLSIKLAAVEAIPWHKYFLTRDEDSLHHEADSSAAAAVVLTRNGDDRNFSFVVHVNANEKWSNFFVEWDIHGCEDRSFLLLSTMTTRAITARSSSRENQFSIRTGHQRTIGGRRKETARERESDEEVGTSIESFRITSLIVHARRRKRTTIRSITLNNDNDDVRIEQLPSLGRQRTNNGPVYGF